MTVLMVGGTGATGRLLVQQLLAHDERVRAIVRTPDRYPRCTGCWSDCCAVYCRRTPTTWRPSRPTTCIRRPRAARCSTPGLPAGSTWRTMARLLPEEALWNRWKGQMPVLYDRA